MFTARFGTGPGPVMFDRRDGISGLANNTSRFAIRRNGNGVRQSANVYRFAYVIVIKPNWRNHPGQARHVGCASIGRLTRDVRADGRVVTFSSAATYYSMKARAMITDSCLGIRALASSNALVGSNMAIRKVQCCRYLRVGDSSTVCTVPQH